MTEESTTTAEKTTSANPAAEQIQHALSLAYAGADNLLLVKKTAKAMPVVGAFTDPAKAATKACELDAAGGHVYFTVCAFKGDKRTADQMAASRLLVVDVDCGDKDKNYPTQRDAVKALIGFAKDYNLPPTLIVDSGGGIHAWYVLRKALAPDTWKALAERLTAGLRAAGVACDEAVTKDAARVIGLPGTHNRKSKYGDSPPLVHIIWDAGKTWDPDILTRHLRQIHDAAEVGAEITAGLGGEANINADLNIHPEGPATATPDDLPRLREALSAIPARLPYDQWLTVIRHAMVPFVGTAAEQDAADIITAWSATDPEHKGEGTAEKLAECRSGRLKAGGLTLLEQVAAVARGSAVIDWVARAFDVEILRGGATWTPDNTPVPQGTASTARGAGAKTTKAIWTVKDGAYKLLPPDDAIREMIRTPLPVRLRVSDAAVVGGVVNEVCVWNADRGAWEAVSGTAQDKRHTLIASLKKVAVDALRRNPPNNANATQHLEKDINSSVRKNSFGRALATAALEATEGSDLYNALTLRTDSKRHPLLFNNGMVLDVLTGEQRAATMDDGLFVEWMRDYPLPPDDRDRLFTVEWLRRAMGQEVMNYVLAACRASLAGDIGCFPQTRLILEFSGKGGMGKSTLLRILEAFGRHVALEFQHDAVVASVREADIITLPEDVRFTAEHVKRAMKAITGGDPITLKAMRQDKVDVRINKLVIRVSNHAMRQGWHDSGIADRWRAIPLKPYREVWSDAEIRQVEAHGGAEAIIEKERGYFLKWVLRHFSRNKALEILRTVPQAVINKTNDSLPQSSHVGSFITDMLEPSDPTDLLPLAPQRGEGAVWGPNIAPDLFTLYQQWLEMEGEKFKLGRKTFIDELRETLPDIPGFEGTEVFGQFGGRDNRRWMMPQDARRWRECSGREQQRQGKKRGGVAGVRLAEG